MENKAFYQNFYKQVLLQLQSMIVVLKKGDTPTNRKQIQEYCQQLYVLGEKAKIKSWCELLVKAHKAIANPQNPYQSSIKIIIKDIRDAGELIKAGKAESINPSSQLEALIVPSAFEETKVAQSKTSKPKINQEYQQKENGNTPDPWETQNSQPLTQDKFSKEPLKNQHQKSKQEELLELFDKTEISENTIEYAKETETEDISNLFDAFERKDAKIEEFDELATLDEFSTTDLDRDLDTEEKDEDSYDIVNLFGETETSDTNFDTSIFDTSVTEDSFDEESFDEESFDEEITISESLNLNFKKPEIIYYYDQFSDLDTLIEQPSIKTQKEIYTVLENLLETNSQTSEIKTQLPSDNHEKSIPVFSPARAIKPGNQRIFEQTMRVQVKELDNLNNLIGELVVKRNRLEEDQERLRQFLDNLLNQVQQLTDVNSRMQYLYERTLLERALIASRTPKNKGNNPINYMPSGENDLQDNETGLNAHEIDSFTQFHPLSQEIIELIVRVKESTSDIQFLVDETDQVARSLRQVTTSLQEGLNHARMVTFSNTADKYLRAVREISLKLKKQAEVVIAGREVLVDKVILDHLYNPLTHLVNNAITHGIELPEVRKARGKNPKGQIKIQAFIQGNQTVISVSDDGAGIDVNKVKAKAIEKKLITKLEAKEISNQEVYDLLFHAGFSTKDRADDFSGRGVGLDVVRNSLQSVRGTVSIDSTLGKGTSFIIRLPLTLSICKALPCLSNNARIAFPIDGIEDTKDYTPEDIQINKQGQKCIPWGDELLPFQSLNNLLSYNRQISRSTIYGGQEYDNSISIVILRGAGKLLAVKVDKILAEQEIVIKQIEGPIPKPAGIAGATVLGDGRIMPIGDILELIDIANDIADGRGGKIERIWPPTYTGAGSDSSSGPKSNSEPIVLIVDDSITVRQLLSLSFTKAGYRVEEARDGQEAWEKLRSGLPCSIVFCDIEMPRMNGLKLLSMMQQDNELRSIPVALLTSRGADKHRQVAAELGASGYLTKPYTEKELLDAAEKMIEGQKLLGRNNHQSTRRPVVTQKDYVVLIIDDSVVVREMLSITFKKRGYRVEQSRDGQEAWEKLRSGLPCDLIFCDIEMPRMNGLELLSLLQENNELNHIPVAMITSRGAERHRKIAAELGAKAYFTKPYIEEELLEAAKQMIAGEVLLNKDSLNKS